MTDGELARRIAYMGAIGESNWDGFHLSFDEVRGWLTELQAWRALGRALVQTPAHTRQTFFYPPSAIESAIETIVQIDPGIQEQARALLGMANSEGEAQS